MKAGVRENGDFYRAMLCDIPTGTPSPNGGVECKGGMKKNDFRPISCFISEMLQQRGIVTMEGEYKTARTLSNGTSFTDL